MSHICEVVTSKIMSNENWSSKKEAPERNLATMYRLPHDNDIMRVMSW